MLSAKEVKVCYLFKTGGCPYIVPKKPDYLIAGIKDGKIKIGYNQCGKNQFCGFYPIYGMEEFFADYIVIDTIHNGNKNAKVVASNPVKKFLLQKRSHKCKNTGIILTF